MNVKPNNLSHELTLGYSTCPNDTFVFHALAHGLVNVIPFDFPCLWKMWKP